MTVTVYPAKLITNDQEAKEWDSPFPLGTGQSTKFYTDAQERMERGEDGEYPNPAYVPFADMDISEGNLLTVLRRMRVQITVDEDWGGRADIHDVFTKAHDSLFSFGRVRDMDQYVAERVFALREMARLGISRGSTHIVWA